VFNTKRGVFLFLLDLFRERIEGPDIEQKIIERHECWKYAIVALETIGFQLLIAQALIRKGIPVREMSTSLEAIYRLDRDKVARAYSATPLMADGRFFVPSYAPWVAEYIKELTVFPNYGHDDQVDVTSAGVSLADRMGGLVSLEELNKKEKPPSYVSNESTNNEVQEVTNQFGLSIARSPLSGYKFSKP
jgi:predicted phage terminase large subunit-like protein